MEQSTNSQLNRITHFSVKASWKMIKIIIAFWTAWYDLWVGLTYPHRGEKVSHRDEYGLHWSESVSQRDVIGPHRVENGPHRGDNGPHRGDSGPHRGWDTSHRDKLLLGQLRGLSSNHTWNLRDFLSIFPYGKELRHLRWFVRLHSLGHTAEAVVHAISQFLGNWLWFYFKF